MMTIDILHPSMMLRRWPSSLSTLAILALLSVFAPAAFAQNTTASIRGTVTDAGAPQAGATIVAKEVSRGYQKETVARGDGSYTLVGLQSGEYEITATVNGQSVVEFIRAQIGQALSLSFDVSGGARANSIEEITVYGTAQTLFEMNTSEVGTNVSLDEIENLPQGQRNFLALAGLAPGILVARDPRRNTFSGGASNGSGDSLRAGQVNVFIDGVSLKSNTQQGGIVGQDGSRGSPFSKLAVQEFKVISNSFKAEYEQAGTSIITAVTKSGSNEFEGEVFIDYTNENFREKTPLDYQNGVAQRKERTPFDRRQFGGAFSGPIIDDKLHFFFSYEANNQARNNIVSGGDGPAESLVNGVRLDPSEYGLTNLDVSSLRGAFGAPFEQNLYFGKLTWQLNDINLLEGSVSIRDEKELVGFGGFGSIERAENFQNDTLTINLKHQFTGDRFLNELSLDYLESDYNPSPVNFTPALIYAGLIDHGGSENFQDTNEKTITLRNNVTFTDIDWHGNHLIKAGIKLAHVKIDATNAGQSNGRFFFDLIAADNLDFSVPRDGEIGVGDTGVRASNNQFGIFVQDDWQLTDRLTLNLGLRWDIESNANNKGFVTSAEANSALRLIEQERAQFPNSLPFRADDYISTGSNRKSFKDAWAPRLGFSYALDQDGTWVLHGSAGRFYDRTLFRNAVEEVNRNLFRRVRFNFSVDGLPRNGQNTILWQPEFLSTQGLLDLVASNPVTGGGAELRLVKNDQRPPHSDQFNLGIRKQFEYFNASLSYTYARGENDIFYFVGNRVTVPNPNVEIGPLGNVINPLIHQNFDISQFGFNDAILSSDGLDTRYKAIFLTLEKPYSDESRWGARLAYTHTDSEQSPVANFLFDAPDRAQPFLPNASDEEHRIVLSGSYLLPFDVRASVLAVIASGQPGDSISFFDGGGPNLVRGGNNVKHPDTFGYKNVDLSLSRGFSIFDVAMTTRITVTNLFDTENFAGLDGFVGNEPGPNPNFGNPFRVIDDSARTVSFSVQARF